MGVLDKVHISGHDNAISGGHSNAVFALINEY